MLEASAFMIIAAAAAGYIYISNCYKHRYKSARQSGHRLYLHALSFGMLYLLASWIIYQISNKLCTRFPNIPHLTVSSDTAALSICFGAVLLSILITILRNKLDKDLKDRSYIDAVMANNFERVCYVAMDSFSPIAVTMENRKLYVGYIIDSITIDEENPFFTILPIYSGYRDKDTLQFMLKTRYNHTADMVAKADGREDVAASLSDYTISLRKDSINTIHLFNDHLHKDVDSQYEPESSGAKSQETNSTNRTKRGMFGGIYNLRKAIKPK